MNRDSGIVGNRKDSTFVSSEYEKKKDWIERLI